MSDPFTNGGCDPSDCASCGGGCGSNGGGCKVDDQHRTITLTMEDDTEVECAILTIFPVGIKEYIALLPNIESDEEYNQAAIAFDTVLQNAKDSVQNID